MPSCWRRCRALTGAHLSRMCGVICHHHLPSCAQRVAAYLLFGSCSRAANLCACAPTSVDDAVRAAGVAKIEKRTPLAAEVERTMRNFGFDEKAIKRALRYTLHTLAPDGSIGHREVRVV